MTNNVSCISPFSSPEAYEAALKMAKAMSYSTFVPEEFRVRRDASGKVIGTDTAISNCLFVMELANAFNLPFAGMIRNITIIHGKPDFSARFMIGRLRNSGQFGPLKYVFRADEQGRKIACHCEALELASGKVVEGPEVSLEIAKNERWGGKWATMPEVMLRYRAAAFFVRLRAPDVILGYDTVEEAEDASGDEGMDFADEPQEVAEKVKKSAVDELNDLLIVPVKEAAETKKD